jgi:uncharacterized SAM-binding protein YcdF (DUF218 family)
MIFSLGSFLITADPLEKSQAVVVLSGGTPGRIETGAQLIKDGWAERLVITETQISIPESDLSYHTVDLSRYAVELGVEENDIMMTDGQALTTVQEANAVRDLLGYYGLDSCIVVTDPAHTRRAKMIFQDIVGSSGIRVGVFPVQGHWYQSDSWFLSKTGWEITLYEVGGLIGYKLGFRN